MIDPQPKSIAARRIALIVVAGLAGAGVGLAGVYGIAGLTRNATGPDVVSNGAPETSKSAANNTECLPALERAKAAAPFARGEVAAVNTAKSPLMLPALSFNDASGAHKSLADFRGRVVLLNLWATWCVPCRKEMPALDALERKLGGPEFEVVSINIDTRDADKPRQWLNSVGVKTLAYYADNNAKVFQDLKVIGKAFGMPTTLIVDRNGCELASLAGPAEWASGDAVKLVEAALKK